MTLPGECDHGEWKCMRQVIYLKIGKCAGFSVLKSVHSLCCVCFSVLNPFPAKSFVPLVKIASKNNLSDKFCWPECSFRKRYSSLECSKSGNWSKRSYDVLQTCRIHFVKDIIWRHNGSEWVKAVHSLHCACFNVFKAMHSVLCMFQCAEGYAQSVLYVFYF